MYRPIQCNIADNRPPPLNFISFTLHHMGGHWDDYTDDPTPANLVIFWEWFRRLFDQDLIFKYHTLHNRPDRLALVQFHNQIDLMFRYRLELELYYKNLLQVAANQGANVDVTNAA